jgi:hypothetical protein
MDTITIPYQTEIAQDGFAVYSDTFQRMNLRRGRQMLQRIGLDTLSPDLQCLAWMTWRGTSETWHADGGSTDYLAVGDITDQISDDEAELLVELEPKLRRWWVNEGVGSMTPEVTAIHDMLLSLAASLVDSWEAREKDWQ